MLVSRHTMWKSCHSKARGNQRCRETSWKTRIHGCCAERVIGKSQWLQLAGHFLFARFWNLSKSERLFMLLRQRQFHKNRPISIPPPLLHGHGCRSHTHTFRHTGTNTHTHTHTHTHSHTHTHARTHMRHQLLLYRGAILFHGSKRDIPRRTVHDNQKARWTYFDLWSIKPACLNFACLGLSHTNYNTIYSLTPSLSPSPPPPQSTIPRRWDQRWRWRCTGTTTLPQLPSLHSQPLIPPTRSILPTPNPRLPPLSVSPPFSFLIFPSPPSLPLRLPPSPSPPFPFSFLTPPPPPLHLTPPPPSPVPRFSLPSLLSPPLPFFLTHWSIAWWWSTVWCWRRGRRWKCRCPGGSWSSSSWCRMCPSAGTRTAPSSPLGSWTAPWTPCLGARSR